MNDLKKSAYWVHMLGVLIPVGAMLLAGHANLISEIGNVHEVVSAACTAIDTVAPVE